MKVLIKNFLIRNLLESKVGFKILKSKFDNVIIMYHGVSDSRCQFNNRHTLTKDFISHLKFLKKYCNILSLNDFCQEKFIANKINVAITFDDGYYNNFIIAQPILEELKVPATFFVTGINSVENKILWADYIDIVTTQVDKEFSFNLENYQFKLVDNIFKCIETKKTIHQIIKNDLAEYEYKLQLYSKFDKYIQKKIFDGNEIFWKLMSDDDIVNSSKSNVISIQSHGFLHNNLGRIKEENAYDEILKSKNYLEQLTQKEIEFLGYPDGSYSKNVVKYAFENGFKYQFAADGYLSKEDFLDSRLFDRKGMYNIGSYKNQIFNAIKK